ncbi:MAG TPA: hypothetical protein VN428_01135 [Bryobacteraceae bacterium]|nr:hypothetical protein [Bryobacteraceae bacterium]
MIRVVRVELRIDPEQPVTGADAKQPQRSDAHACFAVVRISVASKRDARSFGENPERPVRRRIQRQAERRVSDGPLICCDDLELGRLERSIEPEPVGFHQRPQPEPPVTSLDELPGPTQPRVIQVQARDHASAKRIRLVPELDGAHHL